MPISRRIFFHFVPLSLYPPTPLIGSLTQSVGRNDAINGLMENTASMEIRKRRGVPPPLGKITSKSGETFP